MKRRPTSRGTAANARKLKSAKPKRSGKNKPSAGRSSSNDAESKAARLQRELNDALEQQAATSEVLQVISSSPAKLEPVFEAMLTKATRLCEAKFGVLYLYDGGRLRFGAAHDVPPAFAEARGKEPFSPAPDTSTGRVVATKRAVQIADLAATQSYSGRNPVVVAAVEFGGVRTALTVPMLKGTALIGVISIYRKEVRPFTEKQTALLQNFAAQAVIAIENARLLNELRESLEQQTATSEVLKVISSSPGELQPVFQAMLENAARVCDAKFGILFKLEDGAMRAVASLAAPEPLMEFFTRGTHRPSENAPIVRMAKTKEPVHVVDFATDRAYLERSPVAVAGVELGGVRTNLMVPLLKEDELIGAFAIFRQEVRPFTEKQIELARNFAAQAVIAIENARLLNELRESLEQQTATADVLGIISTFPGELEPVFRSILGNATHICAAKFGTLWLAEGDGLRAVAVHNPPPGFADIRRGTFIKPNPKTAVGRVITTKQTVQIVDLTADAAYIERDPFRVAIVEVAGARTLVVVPMLKDGALIGAISIYRQEQQAFTEKQISLMRSFAAQAVIAVENARLLNELRQRTADLSESLEQQTASSEVLKIISSAPGELNAVFEAILLNATRICEATYGNLLLLENGSFRRAAQCNAPQELIDEFRRNPVFVPLPNNPLDRVLKTKETIHTVDARAESNLGFLADARTLLNVPMLSHDELIGTISIYRKEVRPFTDKQVDLVKNFAAQAVIAIENARLLNELRQRTADLSESLEQQTATADVLRVINSSPGDLDPVFAMILDKALDLCEAAFGFVTIYDGKNFERGVQRGVPEALAAYFHSGMDQPRPGDAHWRLLAGENLIHNLDQKDEDAYRLGNPLRRAVVDLGGARTALVVALRKDNVLLGALTVYRKEVRAFSDQHVAILQSFAAHAVIAIENARLLKELRQTTDQLKAQSHELAKLNQQLEARVADQVGEIERMGRLRRFLPPQVADLIVASGAEKQLESHRREITALFCDLRGFTGFSESADPEDVMLLLRQYHEAIGKIIIKYSGTLERYAGDGVMVVFNDPVPVDNPALQAVRMALDMRAALSALIDKWRRLGHELGFGIGIAHGYATLGTIGFEGRFDYAAIGTVSNVASRLCDEAKPGQILISSRVLMAVENAVAIEPVGDFALKGISRPLATYNVIGEK